MMVAAIAVFVVFGVLFVKSTSARDRARAVREALARKAEEDAARDAARPLSDILQVKPRLDDGRRIVYQRGGHTNKTEASVRFALVLVNRSEHRIRPREIRGLWWVVDWGVGRVAQAPTDRICHAEGELVGEGAHEIHEVVALNIEAVGSDRPPSTAQFGQLMVGGTLYASCDEWTDNPRALRFDVRLDVPMEVGNTREVGSFVAKLTERLVRQEIDVLDAEVGYFSDGWAWRVKAAPRTVSVVSQNPSASPFTDTALEEVVDRVVARLPRPYRTLADELGIPKSAGVPAARDPAPGVTGVADVSGGESSAEDAAAEEAEEEAEAAAQERRR
jgi:hypothetical protein